MVELKMIEQQLARIEERLARLELMMAAHRANLVAEQWAGREDVLATVAGFVNELALELPDEARDKEGLAAHFVARINTLEVVEEQRKFVKQEIKRIRRKHKRGALINDDTATLDL